MRVPRECGVEELTPGAELAADVLDSLGRVLARQGAELEETHFRVFRMCGIETVQILAEVADAEPDPEEEARREAAVAALKPRFRKVDLSHPAMTVLLSVCTSRALRLARRGEGSADA